MKHKLLRYSSTLAVMMFLAVFFGLAIKNTPDSTAIKATDFKAGRIIDDSVFYNPNTMTTAQIQAFMDKTLPECDMWGTGKVGSGYYIKGKAVNPNTTRKEYARRMREEVGDKRYHAPPYVCINKYYENPQTHVSNFDTNGAVKAGMISAAQIIHDAAVEFNINPQILLVMLKKESYAWGDNWPTKNEFNTVMGYACPDNAACNTKYYGFYNQVNMAAWQLNYYKQHIYSYNYRPKATNKIYYSPDYSCGSKSVYIENYATASLYIYTPYTPNDAALRNYPSTATCGSYGNRNFFMFFSEWFGSAIVADEYKKIDEAFERLGGKDKFGAKIGSYKNNNGTGIYWQQYEKGYIVGNNKYGFHESSGPIREVWKSFGFEGGKLGFPIDEIKSNAKTGIIYQQYQNGYIVGNDKYGYYESTGNIREYWSKSGFESGKLGFPISNVNTEPTTRGEYQIYENGVVIGSQKTGYYVITKEYLNKWLKSPSEYGLPTEDEREKSLVLETAKFIDSGLVVSGNIYKKWTSLELGDPIDSVKSNGNTGIYWQQYEKGYIVGNDKYGYYESTGSIREVWKSFGFEGGKLGFPLSNVKYNAKTGIYWQQYEKGYIVGNDKYGYHESVGIIREVWRSFGFESGKLGYPLSNIDTNPKTGIVYQKYENGYIVGTDKLGYYESTGKLREYWRNSGFESGKMGFPLSNEKSSGNIIYQKYQKGTLYYDTKTKKYSW